MSGGRRARADHGDTRIFDRSGTLVGPSWLDLIGEGRALLRAHRRRPAGVYLGPMPRGDGHPVIVLPAFLCSDAMNRGLHRWLEALGYRVEGWGGGINIGPSAAAVTTVEAALARLSAETGRAASLVGHSLGGVLARALANAHPERVRRVITVCSPFRLPTASPMEPIYRALAPLHSGQRRMLDLLTAPPPVPTTAIYTPNDGVVAWRSCIDVPGPGRENVAVEGAHSTMMANPRALRVIAERLARP